MTEYLLDCRIERLSFEVIVFCRDTGTKEDVEEVEVREILEAGPSITAAGKVCGYAVSRVANDSRTGGLNV